MREYIRGLLARCEANDDLAWEELRVLIEAPVKRWIEGFAGHSSIGLDDIDDLWQDFYVQLRYTAPQKLRSFEGSTREELLGFARKLILHLLLDRRTRSELAQRRMEDARLVVGRSEVQTVSEVDVEAAWEDLVSHVPERHREAFALVVGAWVPADPGVEVPAVPGADWSERTRRRKLAGLRRWLNHELFDARG